MTLPLKQPFPPMEATTLEELPTGEEWQYEPKWDGFRCIAFRDGGRIELQSKAEKSLTRYFPELVAALAALTPKKFVFDGEIIVPIGTSLSFDALLQRIHPSSSRVRHLAETTPARLLIFDLLVDDKGKSLVGLPLSERRPRLASFAARHLPQKTGASLLLSPATDDMKTVRRWKKKAGDALDGIIAKRLDLPYRSGTRDGMSKIKNRRTADCVIGGFRYSAKGRQLGSLLLGLYDENGLLNHVGFVAMSSASNPALLKKLEGLVAPPGFTGNAPGGPSRWSTERSAEWQPLKPKLVVEVQFDHFTGGRFRHGTKLLRWRPDKSPKQCTLKSQIEQSKASPLQLLS